MIDEIIEETKMNKTIRQEPVKLEKGRRENKHNNGVEQL